jgi:hypothetical protein
MPGMKKSGMPSPAESAASGNRMSKMGKMDNDAVERTIALAPKPKPFVNTGYGSFKNKK